MGLFRPILFMQNNPISEIRLKFQGDLLSYCTGNLISKEVVVMGQGQRIGEARRRGG